MTTALFHNSVVNNALPSRIANNYIDVRDVALAHVLALETPEAGGERIVVAKQNFTWHSFSMSTPILGFEDEQLRKMYFCFALIR